MEISDQLFEQIKREPFFKGKIVSGSMIPVLKIEEDIICEVLSSDIKRFDIIVFRHQKKLICHYVWSKNVMVEPFLIQTRSLRGNKDSPIGPHEYLGKVISHRLSTTQKFKILMRELFT